MLMPFSINMFNQKGEEFSSIGLLVMIFLVSMLLFSILVNRNILDSIKLRLKNIKLLEDLNIQKDLADVANNDKSRFLVATSHDLRKPLYALDIYLGALGIDLKEPKQLDLLDKAQLSTSTLSALLNALMDVSKLDSGGVQPSPSCFDLNNSVLAICRDYEQAAKEKGIEIKTDLNQVSVNTDQVLLGRMIRNLISNAISHNENCCLTIATILDNDKVRLDISDNGKGIAKVELDNIFSEFYQINNPERDKNKGVGLGLAIVKRLSDLLLIPIEVESEIAKGARFSLTLAIEKRKTSRINVIEPIENLALAGLFIIVIEDQQTVRDATKVLLRNWGCEVLVSSSQKKMIATLAKDNYPLPDLIISDYRLRDKQNGIDAVRAVDDYFKTKIPVLIVTGDSSAETFSEVADHNYSILIKPVSSLVLGSKIKAMLKSK
jgi:signal transduction histidine kinase